MPLTDQVLEEELVDKDDALRKQLLGLAGRHPASTNAGNYVVGSVGSSESARAVQDALNSLLPNLAPDKGRVAADGTILAERDELDEQNRKLAAMQDKNRSTRVAAHEETAVSDVFVCVTVWVVAAVLAALKDLRC